MTDQDDKLGTPILVRSPANPEPTDEQTARDRARVDKALAFVRARLDEDERIARAAANLPDHTPDADHWEQGGTWSSVVVASGPGKGASVVSDEGFPSDTQAEHIARHDPARVLDDVAAKRDLIDSAAYALDSAKKLESMGANSFDLRSLCDFDILTMARCWASHPDYEVGWSE
jgi:hypothetical protein